MAIAIWNPDTLFQITKPSRRSMFCVGVARSRYDSQCRWDISRARYATILSILDDISMKPPHDVTDNELQQLARLGLCEHHYEQEDEVVARWADVLDCIEDIRSMYQTVECKELREQNAVLQADIFSRMHRYRELQDRISSLTSDLTTVNSELRDVQSVNLSLKNDKRTMQSEIKLVKGKLKRLNNSKSSLSSQFSSTAASLEAAKNKLSVTQQSNTKLREELTAANGELSLLTGTTATLQLVKNELSASQKENTQLRDELTTATGEIMELRCQVSQLSTPLWYKWIRQVHQNLLDLTSWLRRGLRMRFGCHRK